MAATGLATMGIKLEYKSGSTSSFTELDGLQEVPEIGGTPEKIEVTTLKDTVKKNINGVKDLGDLEFTFLYDNAGANANYRVLKGLETAKEKVTFKLTYPDTTAHQFTAEIAVTMNAAKVNEALTFKMSCALQSEIAITNPTAP